MIIAIDLGTTNIKIASYTNDLTPLRSICHEVEYIKQDIRVEFDPDKYFEILQCLIRHCYLESKNDRGEECVHLVITGQAESLVVVDTAGIPIYNAISWMDMRSDRECQELANQFEEEMCYRITGQPKIIPTWPLTKILWLKYNEPKLSKKIGKYLLLKDYIIFKLTGKYIGEYSIYPFSSYFDIFKKDYWRQPLDYCGVTRDQLPDLVSPCTVVGSIVESIVKETGLPNGSDVNVGTLDHFAGMIGTGNIKQGLVNESAGTVLSIATYAKPPFSLSAHIPLYCGPFENSYIYLPVCESGGISLAWLKNNFISEDTFEEINRRCVTRNIDSRLTFLPYLTGVNSPEFDSRAVGVFYGLKLCHDKYDMALAVMCGVASLLRKNIDYFIDGGISVEKIISTGGGAKSDLWSQIKADICNIPVVIPNNQEAPCHGAAIIASVSTGAFPDYNSAIRSSVKNEKIFYPSKKRSFYESKQKLFADLYDKLVSI